MSKNKTNTDVNIEIAQALGWSDIENERTWVEYPVNRWIGLPPKEERLLIDGEDFFSNVPIPKYNTDLNVAWDLLIKYMPDEISSIISDVKGKNAEELAGIICDNFLIYVSAGLIK